MIDLVEHGSNWDEVVQLAKEIELAGASIINTGIGWHEARVPTIATSVPRGSFSWVTHKLKGEVQIPLVTSNRINMPQTAEDILQAGDITVNKNMVPFDTESPFITSGIRIGTPAITTRGLNENDCKKIVQFIDEILTNVNNLDRVNEVKFDVNNYMRKFPMFRI